MKEEISPFAAHEAWIQNINKEKQTMVQSLLTTVENNELDRSARIKAQKVLDLLEYRPESFATPQRS